MTVQMPVRNSMENIARWTARIVGSLLVLLVLAIFVGEGIFEGTSGLAGLEIRDYVMFAAMFAMVAGLALAWKWEGIGGGLAILGFVTFWLANYLSTGRLGAGWVVGLFPLVGLLFVYCWWRNRVQGRGLT